MGCTDDPAAAFEFANVGRAALRRWVAPEDRPREPPQMRPGCCVLLVRVRGLRNPGEEPLGGLALSELRAVCERFGVVERIKCRSNVPETDAFALVQFATDSCAFAALEALDGTSITGDGLNKLWAMYSKQETLTMDVCQSCVVLLHIQRLRNLRDPPLGGLSLDTLREACQKFGGFVQKIKCSKEKEPFRSLDVLVQFASQDGADALCKLDGGKSLTEDSYNCTWVQYSGAEELEVLPNLYPERMRDFTALPPVVGILDIKLEVMPAPAQDIVDTRLESCKRAALDKHVELVLSRLSVLAKEQRPQSSQSLCGWLQRHGTSSQAARVFTIDPVEVLQLLCDSGAVLDANSVASAAKELVSLRPKDDAVLSLKIMPGDLARVSRSAQQLMARGPKPPKGGELVQWAHRESYITFPVPVSLLSEKLRELRYVYEAESCGRRACLVYELPEIKQELLKAKEIKIVKEIVEAESWETEVPQGYSAIKCFDDLGLQENLLRGIYSYGFEAPSFIQQWGIKPIIDGRNTVMQSQSGSGKTAVYAIGALQYIVVHRKQCQVLVLAPGRELVLQIQKVILALGDYMRIKCHAMVGGTSVRADIDACREGPHVVVGTPGRVHDMLSKRHLRVESVGMVVIDEADDLLSKGSGNVHDILRALPSRFKICLCSSTLSASTLRPLACFMHNPANILVHDRNVMREEGRHFYIVIEKEEWKLDTLCDLYETIRLTQAFVFLRSRRKVDWLADEMSKRDFTISSLHAELDQNERDLVMREFRSGHARCLLTTDLLARGIDVQAVSLVLNYDMPQSPEAYLHQVGRAGRFGRRQIAITFLTNLEMDAMKAIEQRFGIKMEELPMDIADLI